MLPALSFFSWWSLRLVEMWVLIRTWQPSLESTIVVLLMLGARGTLVQEYQQPPPGPLRLFGCLQILLGPAPQVQSSHVGLASQKWFFHISYGLGSVGAMRVFFLLARCVQGPTHRKVLGLPLTSHHSFPVLISPPSHRRATFFSSPSFALALLSHSPSEKTSFHPIPFPVVAKLPCLVPIFSSTTSLIYLSIDREGPGLGIAHGAL
jgi:hypothetical protein